MRRADRLIRMVHFLRGRRRAVTAQQIAEAFEINKRTVYRDMQDLMDAGTPIRGEAGVGYMIDKDYYLPPVAFDPDELEAIALGISMVRHWTDDRFAEQALRALEKVQAVLPSDRQGELQQITTYARTTENAPPWRVSFSDLRECIRKRTLIRIDYTDADGAETQRVLQPIALAFFSPVWLLVAWCEVRQDFRHFRLDRITQLDQLGAVFQDDPTKNLAAYEASESHC